MNDLISKLTGQLGVDESQAKGGVGMLLKMAKDHLGGDEFEQLKGAIPDADEMESAAPDADPEEAGGMMGMLGGVADALGADKLADIAGMAGGFDKLGIDAGTASKFLPMVMEFVKGKGLGGIVEKLTGLLGK